MQRLQGATAPKSRHSTSGSTNATTRLVRDMPRAMEWSIRARAEGTVVAHDDNIVAGRGHRPCRGPPSGGRCRRFESCQGRTKPPLTSRFAASRRFLPFAALHGETRPSATPKGPAQSMDTYGDSGADKSRRRVTWRPNNWTASTYPSKLSVISWMRSIAFCSVPIRSASQPRPNIAARLQFTDHLWWRCIEGLVRMISATRSKSSSCVAPFRYMCVVIEGDSLESSIVVQPTSPRRQRHHRRPVSPSSTSHPAAPSSPTPGHRPQGR